MGTRERPAIFATALILLLLQQALGASLSEIFADGVPSYGTQPGVTVQSRARPQTEAPPIHAGGLLITPRLELSTGYDNNILGGATRQGSWTTGARPSLLLSSNWSHDAFGAYFAAADTRYISLPRQSRTDATATLGGTIDIGRDKLTLGVAHLSLHEDRSDFSALASDRPVALRVDDVRVSYTANFGRWSLTPEAGASSWHYGDTTVLGQFARQTYRDRVVLRGGTTLRYELAPLRNLVIVTRALSQQYANPIAHLPSLNSTGYQALIGLDYDDDTLWRARLLVGAETRQFATPVYRPHNALIAEGELTWNPSGMTTVRGTITRSIEEAAQEGVSGFTYTAGKLVLDHELWRDVLVGGAVGLRHAAYLQGGQQLGESASLGVTWLFNHAARLSATYDLNTVHGTGPLNTPATGVARDVALLTLRLGL